MRSHEHGAFSRSASAVSRPSHRRVCELLKDKLPRLILRRRKEGLDIPAHEWLRGPLKPLLDDALSDTSVKALGILPVEFIKSVKHRHHSRRANLGYHLWGLLTLHLWMRRWNIQHADSWMDTIGKPGPVNVAAR